MLKRICAAVLCLLLAALPAAAESVDLDAIMQEIDEQVKGLAVEPAVWEISADRQSIYLNRPAVTGSEQYTIAYNIYDSNSNPVNYFYSMEDRVAATPGYGGLFNVFIVVTDEATGASDTQNIGWQTIAWPYADTLTVGRAAFEISADQKSVYLTRPAIACRGGDVSIAYNIYDDQGNPVNYFYSADTRVAATPGYAGKFNVFIVVTDLVTGEQDIQNIGWTILGGEEPEPPASGSLLVWVAENAQVLTENLISEFREAHPEYAAWEITVAPVSESETACLMLMDVEGGADVYTFAQDQFARLYEAGALSDVPSSWTSIAQANDAGAVKAATIGGRLAAYPITSDNGYFLYYDKDVITNPGDLSTILADCESAGRKFYMELSSGWYNAAFFFGAGCDISYSYAGSQMTGFNGRVNSAAGLKALKAMLQVAQSPAFANGSSVAYAEDAAAVVSGIWDGEVATQRWSNPGAAKMPKIDGMQLGSFGGFKLIGVKPQASGDRLAAAHCLAAWLAGEQAQIRRQNGIGWLASNPNARARSSSSWYHAGLAAQAPYAVAQGQFPGFYWSVAESFGYNVMLGAIDGMTDADMTSLLQNYQEQLAGN